MHIFICILLIGPTDKRRPGACGTGESHSQSTAVVWHANKHAHISGIIHARTGRWGSPTHAHMHAGADVKLYRRRPPSSEALNTAQPRNAGQKPPSPTNKCMHHPLKCGTSCTALRQPAAAKQLLLSVQSGLRTRLRSLLHSPAGQVLGKIVCRARRSTLQLGRVLWAACPYNACPRLLPWTRLQRLLPI